MKQSSIEQAQTELKAALERMEADIQRKEDDFERLVSEAAVDMRCGDDTPTQATRRINAYYNNTLQPLYGYVDTLRSVLSYFG